MFFETFEKNDNKYYFNYRFWDWIILTSQAYSSKQARDNWIESVKENWVIHERYEILWKNFNLKAKNGEIIWKSANFTNRDECEVIIKNMIQSIAISPIIEN